MCKVVELGVWIAGPAAGGVLADWGADVVKIEPPEGDPARRLRQMLGDDLPDNPVFELDNRGKRSIVLDLATDDGKAAALELLDARRRVRHQRPPRRPWRRLGLDDETLLARNPRLDLRPHHRLRPRGPRRRQGGVRHRRVLVARRHRPPADAARRRSCRSSAAGWATTTPARRSPAASAPRCSTGSRPARASSCRRRCTARACTRSSFDLNTVLGWGRHPAIGARETMPQPVGQQLLGRVRSPLLDRRPRGRPPLAAARPPVGHPEWIDDPRFATPLDRAHARRAS